MKAFVISLFYFTFISLFNVVINNTNSDYVLKEVEVIFNDNKPTIKVFTAAELKRFDGTNDGEPILMSIKGVVFDVSSGKRFYGKDAPYNILVGKDSTKAVAKMSLDPEDLTHDLSDLSGSQLKALDDVFESTYMSKYPIVGYMDYIVRKNPKKFANAKILRSDL